MFVDLSRAEVRQSEDNDLVTEKSQAEFKALENENT